MGACYKTTVLVLKHISAWKLCCNTKYTHAHHVPHAEDIESCQMAKAQSRRASVPLLCSLPTALLHLSRSRVREQSELLRYCRASRLLSLLYCTWRVVSLLRCHAVLCLSCSQAASELKHIKRGTYRRVVRKLCVNSYTSVVNSLRTDRYTYRHTYIYTSTTAD